MSLLRAEVSEFLDRQPHVSAVQGQLPREYGRMTGYDAAWGPIGRSRGEVADEVQKPRDELFNQERVHAVNTTTIDEKRHVRMQAWGEFWDICGCLALAAQLGAMILALLFLGALAVGAALVAMPFATVAYHARRWWMRRAA